MGLFDIFSADPGKQAAGRAFDATRQGFNQGFGQAQRYINRGSRQARGDINRGMRGSLRDINRGTRQAAGQYDEALGNYEELYPTAVAGYNAYGDAFGLNGQEGYDRARDSFRTGPGYEFMVNQGLDALDRRAASRGMLASGNTSIDTMNYVTGLADQEWDDYTAGLSPYLTLAPELAGAQADINDRKAGLYANAGRDRAGIRRGASQDLAGIAERRGGNLADLIFRTKTGIGSAGAQFEADKFAAEQGANQNLWNAIQGVIGGAAQGAGMIL